MPLNKLNKALEIHENSVEALTVRGALFIHIKKYDLAIKDLEKCYEANSDARAYLVTALEQLYDLEKTTDVLNKLREVSPEHRLIKAVDEQRRKIEREKEETRKKYRATEPKREVKEPLPKKSRFNTWTEKDGKIEITKKKEEDTKMKQFLDKDVSKRNLASILAAIDHFDK